MRRSIYAVAAVAGSITLAAGVVAAPSSAYTQKELNMCWANNTPGHVLDLEIVADGPSYKSFSLDNGECIAWDVRPGQYKLTLEDVSEFMAGKNASCAGDEIVRIRVKRSGDSYNAFPLAALLNGSVTTNVRKDRRTTVAVDMRCA